MEHGYSDGEQAPGALFVAGSHGSPTSRGDDWTTSHAQEQPVRPYETVEAELCKMMEQIVMNCTTESVDWKSSCRRTRIVKLCPVNSLLQVYSFCRAGQ